MQNNLLSSFNFQVTISPRSYASPNNYRLNTKPRDSQDLQTRCNLRGFHKWKRSVGAWRLSTLIYGQLRTAYYRHVQLILPSVFPPLVPPSPLLSHLCVVSPSSSSAISDPLSHRSPSLSLSSRVLYLFIPSCLPPSLPPSLHFLLSLTTLPFTVHPSPAPFSRTILYALPRSLSPPFSVAPGVPLVPVPIVDSTSARSRFANIARKRRRRRDYDRIRNHPPESRQNFQVYSQVPKP